MQAGPGGQTVNLATTTWRGKQNKSAKITQYLVVEACQAQRANEGKPTRGREYKN